MEGQCRLHEKRLLLSVDERKENQKDDRAQHAQRACSASSLSKNARNVSTDLSLRECRVSVFHLLLRLMTAARLVRHEALELGHCRKVTVFDFFVIIVHVFEKSVCSLEQAQEVFSFEQFMGVKKVYIYCLVWHPRRVTTAYHSLCSKINMTLSMMHVCNVSRRRPTRDTRGQGHRSQKQRRHFRQKSCQKPVGRCALEQISSLFCVFCPVLDFVKRFFIWRHRTDGRTREFFGRQSEEILLVK